MLLKLTIQDEIRVNNVLMIILKEKAETNLFRPFLFLYKLLQI